MAFERPSVNSLSINEILSILFRFLSFYMNRSKIVAKFFQPKIRSYKTQLRSGKLQYSNFENQSQTMNNNRNNKPMHKNLKSANGKQTLKKVEQSSLFSS